MGKPYLSSAYMLSENPMPVSVSPLEKAASLGLGYLLANIRDDGSFNYKQKAKTGIIFDEYNILRHAGALYVLYQYLDSDQLHLAAKRLQAAEDYLHRNCVPLKDHPECLCVIENKTAKLGGSALTLLTFIEHYKRQPDPRLLDSMQRLAAFIVWMQEPSGRFKSKLMSDDFVFSDFDSVYYPGEAILALTRLYAIDPDPRWLQTITFATDYQVATPVRHSEFDRGHNHWFATALPEVYALLPSPKYRQECWLIAGCTAAESALPQAKGMTVAQLATRGETLISAIHFARHLHRIGQITADEYRQCSHWLSVCDDILSFCLSHQIEKLRPDQHPRMLGGIINQRKNSSVRIDYVQHVLSVVMGRIELIHRDL